MSPGGVDSAYRLREHISELVKSASTRGYTHRRRLVGGEFARSRNSFV